MSTAASIIDLSRIDLNDPDAVTWTNAELLKHVLSGVNLAFRVAPHLFFGQYDTMPLHTLTLTDDCLIPSQYDRALADYCTARAHMRDDEDAKDTEASLFVSLFKAELGA